MLTPAIPNMEVVIDPHNGGEVMFLQEAADRIAALHGAEVCPPHPHPSGHLP